MIGHPSNGEEANFEWEVVIEDLLAKAHRRKDSVRHFCYLVAHSSVVDRIVKVLNDDMDAAYEFWARPWKK